METIHRMLDDSIDNLLRECDRVPRHITFLICREAEKELFNLSCKREIGNTFIHRCFEYAENMSFLSILSRFA